MVSAIALAVLHATPFGARVFALGANPLASALSGVGVISTTTAVYAVSGFTAGLAGVLVLGMNGQGYVGIGDPYLLASIAAVVLGGTSILGGSGTYAGSIPGAIPGGPVPGFDLGLPGSKGGAPTPLTPGGGPLTPTP